MYILTRKKNQEIVIETESGDKISIVVLKDGKRIKLGFENYNTGIKISRGEVSCE